ncbi:sensor histidine kinase [Nitrosophilus alvini]|uniref:sensor histidine kinase n=1 Tax=Nitrosophilus alvini TaxID=2714855 RepID=UPI00190D6564|nr:HAMP domain-containing sensor histidine kinase [Nitrosophilus alvini]
MSVSKSLATNLLPIERRTLLAFLSLYTFLTLVILILVSVMYYNFQKDLMLSKTRPKLQEYAKELIYRLKEMHYNFPEDNHYPRYSSFKSAIYDADYVKIFSLLEKENVRFDKSIYKIGDKIHLIKQPDAYYLGTKYVVIEVDDDESWLKETKRNIIFYGSLFLLFMVGLGLFLTKLFLKPMRDTLMLLDNFIKDTTHELNTPVSAILANIETIDKTKLDNKTAKKINRIDIAARTISNIYHDLTFLTLNRAFESLKEKIDMKSLIKERVNFFKILADSKKIDFELYLDDSFIFADRKKIARLIDNILSNAIKYNKIGGKIKITLKKGYLCIEDTGIGIEKEKMDKIYDRYIRFDKSEGGFGIGLNIVKMIADEYNIDIKIKSEKDRGTKVILKWQE